MKDRQYTVYMHVQKDNKKTYIGITYHSNPNLRWRNGKGYKNSIRFKNAILKYGWDSFLHIILCKNTTKERAIIIEKHFISIYKKLNLSYNIGEGGEGSESFSEETKEKLSKYTPWIKGKHHTKEARKLISEALKKRERTKETNLKISTSNKGHPYYPLTSEGRERIIKLQSKPVLQYTKDGKFIKEFNSAVEAERFLNVKGGHVSSCCTGKRKTAYGYKWCFKIS